MFGIKAKKQKIDAKKLLIAIDSALEASDAASADQLLSETGKTRQELLDAVMADDEVISCYEDLQGAINAEAWRIWGEDVNEELINHLIKTVRRLLPDFIQLVLLAKFNGYAVAEYVFEQQANGFLTLKSILSKDGELDSYTPQRDGTVTFGTEDEVIEIDQNIKYLVLKNKAVPARPAGELLVIRAYPAVALRRREWAYAGQFIARYAQPYVVGKQGNSGFGGNVADFTSKIFAFINGGAMGVGADDEINLHQLNGNGEAFELFERLANRRIQKLLLGKVKTSELTSGSRAAQETDDEARHDRISGYLSLMTRGIQHAIDAIITVNQYWGVPIVAPQGIWFEYQKQAKPDQNRATVDKTYAETGQIVFTKEYYSEILGYEEKHFKMVEPSDKPAVAQLAKQVQALSMQLSNGLPDNITEPTTDDDIEHDRAIMQPKITALLSLLGDCASYSEFEERLRTADLPDAELIADLANQCGDSYVQGITEMAARTDEES